MRRELAPLGLAHVHLEDTTGERLLLELHRIWPGSPIVNPTFLMGPKASDQADGERWLATAPTS